jgi:hypothetical protein
MNFDKHHVEKRHDKRFFGIFLMFAVIAVFLGFVLAFTVTNTTGYGIFGSLSTGSSSSGGGSGGGSAGNGTNGTDRVTYQGVLNMLNNCKLTVMWDANSTCNSECAAQQIGTCTESYVTNYITHSTFRYECGWLLGPGSDKSLTCNCCKVPGNSTITL